VVALVVLARCERRIQAELAKMYLGADGIDSILFDAEMNNVGWGTMMPVRLMVLDEDLDDARAILAEDLP
jgi:hypothetical protein